MGPFPGCEKRCDRKAECEHGCLGFSPSPWESRGSDCRDNTVKIIIGDLHVSAETLDQALCLVREELRPWKNPR